MTRQEYVAACQEENKSLLQSTHVLLEYKRDRHRRKIGVVLAYKQPDGQVLVGYSKCHIGMDEFDRDIGIAKAVKRAAPVNRLVEYLTKRNGDAGVAGDVPNSLELDVLAMCERAARFFAIR